MEKKLLIWLFLLASVFSYGQGIENYHSLDAANPIYFGGSYIVYKKDTIKLSSNSFFIDKQLSDAITKKYPYVFNSVNTAAAQLSNGTEQDRMNVYIAPNIYWIDNPDDTATRTGVNGQPPFGLIIKCEWLRFCGLSDDPKNVVLACNRGQTIGAKGNFTMFRFYGQGTGAENITFGNYCNIDLEYPLLPELNRKKRAAAIVQAQLIICDGDKIFARNSRFVSRLNLCPFVGGKRVLFDSCHFEMTDDALCGTAVYLNSTFDFYSSKPFYRTNGTGAVFLNCDITSYVRGEQYFTKANGQVAVIDTRIKTPAGTYIGWQDVMPAATKNYQYGVLQNDMPAFVGVKNKNNTVTIADKPLQFAYRFMSEGKTIYNTYNLLQGDDDWDPLHIKTMVQATEKKLNKRLSKLPVQLLVSSSTMSIETNKSEAMLFAKQFRFGNYASAVEKINWYAKGFDSLVRLIPGADGSTCKVIATNNLDVPMDVVIVAATEDGLEGACVIKVLPPILPAPVFTGSPSLIYKSSNEINVHYKLNTLFKDESIITWYRCRDTKGSNAIEVAVSRFNKPYTTYPLTEADAGYYIMAVIQPKHIRSDTGSAVSIVLPKPVAPKNKQNKQQFLETDFRNVSTRNQTAVLPGFFMWGHLSTVETERRFAVDTTKDAWFYGEGSEGAAGAAGVLQGRNGKMRYTPAGEKFGDMELTLAASPFKSAGQGFSVAPLYMDVLIKMDNKTMNGYGLRLIRTTKYHDAVDVYFVAYTNGAAKQIGDAVSTTVFRSVCTITVGCKGNMLWAKLNTSAVPHLTDGKQDVQSSVDISTAIIPNDYGGLGIEFRGGSPVVFSKMKVRWK